MDDQPNPHHIISISGMPKKAKREDSDSPTQPAFQNDPDSGRPAVSSPSTAPAQPSRLRIVENLTPEDFSDFTDASKDSFDWTAEENGGNNGNDELIFEDDNDPDSVISTGARRGFLFRIINYIWMAVPKPVVNGAISLMIIAFFAVWTLSALKIPIPQPIESVPTRFLVTLAFLGSIMPIWISVGITRLVRKMRHSSLFSKTEYTGRLEAIKNPLTFTLVSSILAVFWISYMPLGCGGEDDDVVGEGEVGGGLGIIMKMFMGAPKCTLDLIPRVWLFLVVAGAMFTIDILFMKIIRSSFQERTFKKRVLESRFKIFVIDQLNIAARHRKSMSNPSGANQSRIRRLSHVNTLREILLNMPFIIPDTLRAIWKSVARAFGGRGMQRPYIQLSPEGETPALASLDEQGNLLGASGTGTVLVQEDESQGPTMEYEDFKSTFSRAIQESGYESLAQGKLRSDHEAKLMGRMIWHYLVPNDRNFLTIEDFAAIIPNPTACNDAYEIFDLDEDGNISKAEFRCACVRIFREQANIQKSIANSGTALGVLDSLANFLVCIVLFLFALTLVGMHVSNLLAVCVSVALALNFIIFDAANKTFHSIIFLFVRHPFDIGDKVITSDNVASSDEDVLTVNQINIQTTEFKKWNGMIVSIPNHILAGGPLTNISKSTEQWERVEFTLDAPDQNKLTVSEQTDRLADLRDRIDKFVLQYPQDYYQSFELRAVIAADSAKSEKNLDTLKLQLKIRCRWATESQRRWVRHARILAFVKQAVRASGIKFAFTA